MSLYSLLWYLGKIQTDLGGLLTSFLPLTITVYNFVLLKCVRCFFQMPDGQISADDKAKKNL